MFAQIWHIASGNQTDSHCGRHNRRQRLDRRVHKPTASSHTTQTIRCGGQCPCDRVNAEKYIASAPYLNQANSCLSSDFVHTIPLIELTDIVALPKMIIPAAMSFNRTCQPCHSTSERSRTFSTITALLAGSLSAKATTPADVRMPILDTVLIFSYYSIDTYSNLYD